MSPARKRNVRRSRKAFTLLEILLVVGLLALLAAFVVPSLVGQADAAKIKMAEAAIGSNGPLLTGVDLFKVNVGVYPEELKYLYEKPDDDELAEKWIRCIKDLSGLNDPWGHEYQYDADGEHNPDYVDLWSMGPNGVDGDEDDVTNWESDR